MLDQDLLDEEIRALGVESEKASAEGSRPWSSFLRRKNSPRYTESVKKLEEVFAHK